MDWSRSPLIECFERGDVSRDLRMIAASGGLGVRVPEQLALLMLLVSDADPAVAARAARTVSRLPPGDVEAFLASPGVPEHVRTFFATRPAGAADDQVPEGDEPVPAEPDAREDEQAGGPETVAASAAPESPGAGAGAEQAARVGAVRRLALMTVAERMKAAIQGSREERSILVRDPNRIVAAAVLSSPKLTEGDVEAIARMTNVSEDVLRAIGTNRTWTKNYTVISALARNAKTPVGVSLAILPRLTEREIKLLSADRNVPEPVRLSARKLYARSASRRQ